jgi:ATP/maltotriose-dependent transcriptional regulator MalT
MARVRLLCAPAGSGKSALLTECMLQAPASCAVRWLALAGAALSVEGFCQRLGQALGLPDADEEDIRAALHRVSQPTWLVLDDYCRQPEPALDALLDRLLALNNPALTWWIATRRRPPCNWPRLLLDDELHECDSATLALTPEEIAQALTHLPAEQVCSVASRIVQRTGGWCAGVRMALLQKCDWAQNQPPQQQRIDTLFDYLQHELFSHLSPELAEAWRVLAHLPRFNADLCEHLFGAGEGAQYLRELQMLGCFIEPWQASNEWLQVFPPLTRVMQEAHWPQGRSWHRLACQWFCAREDWRAAFEQALHAQEYEVAISLLQHFTFEDLFEDQTVVLLLRLHEQQGEELTLCSPQQVGMITAALLFAGRFEQAAACIEHMARFVPQPSARQQRQWIARWQALQGWLLHLQGRMTAAREHFQEALAELSADAWTARLLCLSGQTQQALLCGELELAYAINREALCLARAQGSLLFEGLLELDHAQWLEQRGAPARAEQLLANMQALLEQRESPPVPLRGRIALRRGRLALCMGEEARAAGFFRSGLDDCLRSHDKRVLYGFLGLAQLAANHEDYAQAFGRLRDAERLMQQRQIPDTVYRGVLLQVSSQFWLQQGRPELAEEALSRVLRHFRGDQARQAPPATLELIARIEYLLLIAQMHQRVSDSDYAVLLSQLHKAQRSGSVLLEVELFFALAEAASLLSRVLVSQQHQRQALELVDKYNLQQSRREFELRQAESFLSGAIKVAKNNSHLSGPERGSLSQRELQVLQMIALGDSNLQIAQKLFISLHTVKTHVRRIYGKLGVTRRTHAVATARMHGFMS